MFIASIHIGSRCIEVAHLTSDSYLTFPKTSSPPGMCLKWMLSGKTSILKQVKRLKGCQNNAVQSKDVSQAAGIMQNVPGIKDDSCMTLSVPQGG